MIAAPLHQRWPSGAPRVLVTDCWLTNAGDAAIALATQGLIREVAPGAAILHAAYGSDQVGHHYPQLAFTSPLEQLVGTSWSPPPPELIDVHGALVAGADLVVSQGGGFLREEYRPWARLDALARIVDADAPLVLLGQSIGRFDRAFARRRLSQVLRAAAAVVVRDPASLVHVRDLGATGPSVQLGGDVAVALVGEPKPIAKGPVSVVLSAAGDRGSDRGATAHALLDAVLRRLPDARVLLWSSAQCAGDDADEEVGRSAVAHLALDLRARVDHIVEHVPAQRLLELSATSAIVVSMRFHPALLAAAQGTPSVLLLDEDKAGAVAGTALGLRTIRTSGGAAAEAAAALAAGDAERWGPEAALTPLREGVEVARQALGEVMERLD